MPKRKHYQLLILIPMIAVTVFLVFLNLTHNSDNNEEPDVVETVLLPCSNEEMTTIIKDASHALDPTHPENSIELSGIAAKILDFDNYEDDAYCLHILTTNSIYESDYPNAKKYLELLEQKLVATGSADLQKKVNFLTVAELRENVDFLKLSLDEIESNNPYGAAQ